MPVTIVGTNGALLSGNSTSISVPMPAGLADGQFVGIAIVLSAGATLTTPTGWTLLKSGGGFATIAVFYQIVTGTPPSSTTVSWDLNRAAGAVSFAYSGVDTVSPIDSSASAVVDSPSTGISTTTVHDNALLVMPSGLVGASGSIGENIPSGWTREAFSPTPASSAPQMYLYDQATVTGGLKSTTAPTQFGGSTSEETYLFSLNPALAVPNPICMII